MNKESIAILILMLSFGGICMWFGGAFYLSICVLNGEVTHAVFLDAVHCVARMP